MSIKSMPIWKWVLLLILSLFLSLLLYGLGGLVAEHYEGWLGWFMTIVTATAMLGLYAFFVHLFEGSRPKDLPMNKCAGHTALGLAVGVGNFVLVVGAMILFGLCRIAKCPACDWRLLSDAFAMFLIVAVGEEIVFRGVLFRWIDEKWGLVPALVVSGLFFGLAHITNGNATLWSSIAIALESGLMLGMAYKWAGTLWFPIGIHWSWNFVQGNIFGFAVSGTDAGSTLLNSTVSGPDWLTGGDFGAEASVISVVFGLGITIWFIWDYLRHHSGLE